MAAQGAAFGGAVPPTPQAALACCAKGSSEGVSVSALLTVPRYRLPGGSEACREIKFTITQVDS